MRGLTCGSREAAVSYRREPGALSRCLLADQRWSTRPFRCGSGAPADRWVAFCLTPLESARGVLILAQRARVRASVGNALGHDQPELAAGLDHHRASDLPLGPCTVGGRHDPFRPDGSMAERLS
jgi:hypothetical protein